jgi:hypothetical protein
VTTEEATNPTELNFSDGGSSDFEESLRCVELHDDNITILINGELGYPIRLPKYISVKRKREDKTRIVENKILDGCNMHGINYVSEDNVRNLTKEIVDLLYQRTYVAETNEEEEQSEQQQSSPPVAPTIELTEDLTKEISWNEVASILSTSIKKDYVPKLITFSGMLLAQTNKDQLNIGFQAESAAGKSYIPFEIASYFPPNEIIKIASASPTAFYHRGGIWDESRKAQVCDLENKIVIFSDQPGFQLIEKIRSVLSKDDKELTYWITDKNRSGANRTKTIIIKGFASFFFCTAKTDPDEQEKTRLILLSPEIDQDKLYESLELAALRNADIDEYRKLIEQDPKRKWLIDRILAIRQLGIREIIVPDKGRTVFERFIREHKNLIARYQRDFPRIFSFIKAHALLNCFNRERLTNSKSGTIVATDTDIDAGFTLYKEIEESNELGLSPYIYRIYKQVIEPELNPINGLSRKDIRSKYFSVFHKFLQPKFEDAVIAQIEAAGLIQQEPDPEDRRKLLVLPSPKNDTEKTKYIPHDSGYSSEKPDFSDKNDNDTNNTPTEPQNQEHFSEEGFHVNVGNVGKIENFSPPPTVLGDISWTKEIEESINKAVGDRDYCTEQDFVFVTQMEPNLHWSEAEAEQTFYTLVEEGKMIEIEPGKYKPVDEGELTTS